MKWTPAEKPPMHHLEVLVYTSLGVYGLMWHGEKGWEGDLRGTPDDPERVLYWAQIDPPPGGCGGSD